MNPPAVARWFNLCHDAQRADGPLNKLKVIQDGARQGQQLTRERNNDDGAHCRDRGALPHPCDRTSAAMEDAIVRRVSRTLSAQSHGCN